MSRSLKKGPFLSFALFKKIKKLSSFAYFLIIKISNYSLTKKLTNSIKKVILTWSRSSTVLPLMIGYTFALYNGREHMPIYISEQMVGHI